MTIVTHHLMSTEEEGKVKEGRVLGNYQEQAGMS